MKPILTLAAVALISATTAAPALTYAHPKTHAHKVVNKTPAPLAKPASENPCADTVSASGATTAKTNTQQYECNGLRTVVGVDAADKADTRGSIGDNSGTTGAQTPNITDTDGFVGMGTTKAPEKK